MPVWTTAPLKDRQRDDDLLAAVRDNIGQRVDASIEMAYSHERSGRRTKTAYRLLQLERNPRESRSTGLAILVFALVSDLLGRRAFRHARKLDREHPVVCAGEGVQSLGSSRLPGYFPPCGMSRAALMSVDRRGSRPAGSALTLLADGVGLLDPEARVLEAMLTGWGQQMLARNLAQATVDGRLRQVRALVEHANEYPWQWSMATADDWFSDHRSVKQSALSTIRGMQVTIRQFCDYLTDPAYDWPATCQERFGTAPVQIINEVDAAAHVADYEGDPTRRAFTRAELVALLDHVDATAATRQSQGDKGWASVFRDSVIFKVAYGYGTRRNESRMLDLTDLSGNPHAPEFGNYGVVSVRYGKAQRGSAPKRRGVLTVWPWTVDVLHQWVTEVRPLFAHATGPALFPSERGDRVTAGTLDRRLRGYCDERA